MMRREHLAIGTVAAFFTAGFLWGITPRTSRYAETPVSREALLGAKLHAEGIQACSALSPQELDAVVARMTNFSDIASYKEWREELRRKQFSRFNTQVKRRIEHAITERILAGCLEERNTKGDAVAASEIAKTD